VRSRLILLLSLAVAACSGDDNETTNETPAVGFVRVTAATSGLLLDGDGYTVTLDPGGADAQSQPLPTNGKADFGGVLLGDHTFVVEGLADNCITADYPTQRLTVVGAQIQPLSYQITCTGTPLTGPNQIAFESDRDGFGEIYTMNSDGTHQTRVTHDELINIRPSFAPDGSAIAFAQSTDAGDDDVFVVAPNGSGETDLTESGDLESDPSWSPDATRIAFLINVDFGGGVAVMNADGTEFRNLFFGSAAGKPAWSPDGMQIAFESSGTIMVMSANGGTATPIGPADSHNPAWSPDGTRIAFDSPSQPDGAGIFVMGTEGSGVTRLTTGDDHAPTWSPNGGQIAFSRGAEDTEAQDIFVVNADASGLIQLTTDSAADSHPSWSH
jgi:Tol biopolymer transport system component